MEVNIKTLTPLWTGGVETGKVDRIHETGILGSLRWWMEVLVRGMGGKVDDPTSESRSGLDPEKFDIKAYRQLQNEVERRLYLRNAGLCDVSQIFGATGWKRRFRLEVQEVDVSDASIQHPMKANRTYTDKQGNQKTPTWYFPDPTKKDIKPQPQNTPKAGVFIIKIQSLDPNFKPEVIGGLIQFMADWSALGARPQMGFGVIKILDAVTNGQSILQNKRIPTQSLYDWLAATIESTPDQTLPSLKNIFLAKIQPKDSNKAFTEEDTFNLKYDLRQLFRAEEKIRTEEKTNEVKSGSKGLILKKDKKDNSLGEGDGDKDLRHFIMGTVEDDRQAAKIKISRPYIEDGKSTIRVWGWIPEEAKVPLKDGHEKDLYINGWDRGKVVDAIYQHLTANYTLHDWREMNSARDTETSNISDAKVFLHSLLKLGEDGDAV